MKKCFSLLFAAVWTLLCITSLFMPSYAVSLSATAALLYEPSSRSVLLEKNADARLPMASTTKVMTALTALTVLSPDLVVSVPKEAVGVEGTSAYLEEGERLKVRDLLYALLLSSANDAAVTLACAADGSTEAFADRMNLCASEWGLTATHFTNPHGLPCEEHYTTAYELALIAARALENDLLRTICAAKTYTADTSLKRRTFVNHNKLLSRNENAIGVKTGFTKASGRCLIGAAQKDGMTLISVTLNAPNDWNDHEAMWAYGFSEYEIRDALKENAFYKNISVIGSILPYVSVTNHDAVRIFCKKSDPPFTFWDDCMPYQTSSVKQGDVMGTLYVRQGNKVIVGIPLYATMTARS